MSEVVEWPPLPDIAVNDPQADVKKVLYEAQVQAALSQLQNNASSRAAAEEHDFATQAAVYQAYLDSTKAALDRSQSRAGFIQTAAAAVSTAYAAILGLLFKPDVTSAGSNPIGIAAITPTIFLGFSILLSAVYLAYLTKGRPVVGPRAGRAMPEDQQNRLDAFNRWVSAAVMSRVWFLHAAIFSFAAGVATLPFVFARFQTWVTLIVIVGIGVLVITLPSIPYVIRIVRTWFGEKSTSGPPTRALETTAGEKNADEPDVQLGAKPTA
jgi:hypothetical protein